MVEHNFWSFSLVVVNVGRWRQYAKAKPITQRCLLTVCVNFFYTSPIELILVVLDSRLKEIQFEYWTIIFGVM